MKKRAALPSVASTAFFLVQASLPDGTCCKGCRDTSSLLYPSLAALQPTPHPGRGTELGPPLWLPWGFGIMESA